MEFYGIVKSYKKKDHKDKQIICNKCGKKAFARIFYVNLVQSNRRLDYFRTATFVVIKNELEYDLCFDCFFSQRDKLFSFNYLKKVVSKIKNHKINTLYSILPHQNQ
jgi:ribosomal protein L37E